VWYSQCLTLSPPFQTASKGEPIHIYGDGEQTMDLLHAEDAARANVMALLESEVQDEIFNVGTGVETSVN